MMFIVLPEVRGGLLAEGGLIMNGDRSDNRLNDRPSGPDSRLPQSVPPVRSDAAAGAPRPAASAPSAPSTPRPGVPRPAPSARRVLPRGSAGIGSIFTLAFLAILLPGVAAYALLRLAGLAIGPAGLLGLLVMFVCLGLYPSLLQRLGWVPRRRARRTR
ncbi:hypothetical protein [Protofrankia coriariae]|nr:hypothetical protein [Protofrankia coriariae]